MQDKLSKTLPVIVSIVCATLALIAFFVAWVSLNGHETGMEFIDHAQKWVDAGASGLVPFVPITTLIISIVCVILAFLDLCELKFSEKEYGGAQILGGAIIILFTIVFIMTEVTFGNECFKFTDSLSAGVWLSLIAGIILALSGIFEATGIYRKIAD